MAMQTERLILRQWQESDLQPFYALNSCPRVMEHFPATLTRAQSDALAAELQRRIDRDGWGLWAVEERDTGCFAGFVGLNRPVVDLPFGPCTEVGWRLASQYWGKGYATEAGTAALHFAFTELVLPDVVSFTSVSNRRSIAVMRRLGMVDTMQNFQHPAVPDESPLREHLLYRITRAQWGGVDS